MSEKDGDEHRVYVNLGKVCVCVWLFVYLLCDVKPGVFMCLCMCVHVVKCFI